ncbi:phage tail tape measure protein [Enterococcus faecium]|nr:phage tail tape measure protein [Enterococcus faecium]
MAESYSITAVLQAIDKNFSSTFSEAEKRTQRFQKAAESATGKSEQAGYRTKAAWSKVGAQMEQTGATMTKKVSLPIVAGFGLATKVGMEFEAQMSRVQAILGATPADMKKLNGQAKKLGADTAFSAKEAANGMEQLASAGFSTEEVMKAMPGLLDLAAVSGKDVGMASEYTASAIRQFGLEAGEAGHVADVFARAAADTNAEAKDMGYALKYAGTAAHSAGWSLEETAAAIGIMSNAGIKGEQAGTTLRGALTRLMKPTKAMRDSMDRLGISMYDSQGKMYPLENILGQLKSSTKGLTDEQKNQELATLFGTEALSGMLALVDAGPGQLNKLKKGLEESDGAAKEMAKTMMDNSKGSLEEMMGSLETLGIIVFENLKPVFDIITNVVKGFTNALLALPKPMQSFIVSALAIVAALGPVLWIGGKVIGIFLGLPGKIAKVIGIGKRLIGGVKALWGLMAAHPFVLIIGAIVALIAYFVHLYKTNEEFRKKVDACWQAIKDIVAKSIEKFKQDMESIKKFFGDAWDAIKQMPEKAANKAKEAWGNTKEWFANTWNGLKETAAQTWDGIKQTIAEKWQNIKDGASQIWQDMTEPIKAFYDKVAGFFEPLTDSIVGAFEWLKIGIDGVWIGIQNAAASAWEIIKSIVMGPVLFLCDLIAGNFEQLKEDMSMIWTTIKDNAVMLWESIKFALSSAWEGISGFFRQIFGGMVSQAQLIWIEIKYKAIEIWNSIKDWFAQTWKNIKDTAVNTWNSLKDWLKNTWQNIKDTAANIWNGLKDSVKNAAKDTADGARNTWQAFKDWCAQTWQNIKDTAVGMWNSLKDGVMDTVNGLVEGAQGAWEELKSNVSSAIDAVKGFFDGLRNINLWEAGKAIIDSFLDGLKSAYEKVQDFVGGIADWIREHKGPIRYDRKLLIPAGKAIMNGLNKGLVTGFGAVQNTVNGMAGAMVRAFNDNDVTAGINDVVNSANPTLTLDKVTRGKVTHELSGNTKQPAYLTLVLGDKEYKGFVSDIFDTGEGMTDVRLSVF